MIRPAGTPGLGSESGPSSYGSEPPDWTLWLSCTAARVAIISSTLGSWGWLGLGCVAAFFSLLVFASPSAS